MKAFKVTGTFKMGRNKNQPFSKEILAANSNQAKEKIFSNIGSKHKIKRNFITITKVKEIKPEEIESQYVKDLLEQG